MQQRGLSPSPTDRLTAPPHRPSQGEGLCPSLQAAELSYSSVIYKWGNRGSEKLNYLPLAPGPERSLMSPCPVEPASHLGAKNVSLAQLEVTPYPHPIQRSV